MLAAMSAGPPKTITVPLTFLGPSAYHASFVRDDKENDAAMSIENATVQRSDSLKIELRSAGGFVGRFSK